MARRGRFGRRPRSAPALTNQLVAIARQMQSQRDQNLMDAWQKGGLFEGKPATDELVLAHWNERMKSVSKDDPLYDTYRNAQVQYDYAIHESKMRTKYDQGKVSDGEMAAFYLNWAKKIPKNSEFYRVLQRDGAQFMRTAKAKGDASRKQAAENDYYQAQNDIYKSKEAAGQYITTTLTQLGQRGVANLGIGRQFEPGQGLTDMSWDDPAVMERIIGLLTPALPPEGSPGGEYAPSTKVLMHDSFGNPITVEHIVNRVRALDPEFDGNISVTYVQDLIKRQQDGILERMELARDTGHASDYKQLQGDLDEISAIGRGVNAWPVTQDYYNLNKQFDNAINAPGATPQDRARAWDVYQRGLMALSEDPRIAGDDAYRSRLVGEANLDTSAPSIMESLSGDGFPEGSKDIAETAYMVESDALQVDAVASGQAFWTTGDVEDGVFIPGAGGSAIGAATPEQIRDVAPAGVQQVFIPDASGKATQVTVIGSPIKAKAVNPDGGDMPQEGSTTMGTLYRVSINGQRVDVYGFDVKMPDGSKREVYSTDPPWDPNQITKVEGTGGITLLVHPKFDENGKVYAGPGIGEKPVKGKAPQVVVNLGEAVYGSDPTRAPGSYDPETDFLSVTTAAMDSIPDGAAALTTMSKDPAVRAEIEREAAYIAGVDPATGMITNQAAYDAHMKDWDRAAWRAENGKVLRMDNWTRDAVGSSLPMASEAERKRMQLDLSGGSKLATDLLKGTPFEALGTPFNPGTGALKPPPQPEQQGKPQGPEIRLGGILTVPSITKNLVPSMKVPTPAPLPSPVTQGFIPTYDTRGYKPPAQPKNEVPTYSPPNSPGYKPS